MLVVFYPANKDEKDWQVGHVLESSQAINAKCLDSYVRIGRKRSKTLYSRSEQAGR